MGEYLLMHKTSGPGFYCPKIPFIISPKPRPKSAPIYFYMTACSEVSKELRLLSLSIHPLPDSLVWVFAPFVFNASSDSKCTLERVCVFIARHRDIQTKLIYSINKNNKVLCLTWRWSLFLQFTFTISKLEYGWTESLPSPWKTW